MLYTVRYREYLDRTMIVEADSNDGAFRKVIDAVNAGDIILDSNDYSDCEIAYCEPTDKFEIELYPRLEG